MDFHGGQPAEHQKPLPGAPPGHEFRMTPASRSSTEAGGSDMAKTTDYQHLSSVTVSSGAASIPSMAWPSNPAGTFMRRNKPPPLSNLPSLDMSLFPGLVPEMPTVGPPMAVQTDVTTGETVEAEPNMHEVRLSVKGFRQRWNGQQWRRLCDVRECDREAQRICLCARHQPKRDWRPPRTAAKLRLAREMRARRKHAQKAARKPPCSQQTKAKSSTDPLTGEDPLVRFMASRPDLAPSSQPPSMVESVLNEVGLGMNNATSPSAVHPAGASSYLASSLGQPKASSVGMPTSQHLNSTPTGRPSLGLAPGQTMLSQVSQDLASLLPSYEDQLGLKLQNGRAAAVAAARVNAGTGQQFTPSQARLDAPRGVEYRPASSAGSTLYSMGEFNDTSGSFGGIQPYLPKREGLDATAYQTVSSLRKAKNGPPPVEYRSMYGAVPSSSMSNVPYHGSSVLFSANASPPILTRSHGTADLDLVYDYLRMSSVPYANGMNFNDYLSNGSVAGAGSAHIDSQTYQQSPIALGLSQHFASQGPPVDG